MPAHSRYVCFLSLFVVATGCGRIGYDELRDAHLADSSLDASADAGLLDADATVRDAALDLSIDMIIDAGMDGSEDASVDAMPSDADVDAESDAETDSGPPPEPGIVFSRTAGLVTTEFGMADTFTVALAAAPTSDVTVDLRSSNTLEVLVSPATLTFTAADFATPQTVTVTGVDDLAVDGDQAFTVVTDPAFSADPAYSGVDPDDVVGTNHDDETAGIVIVTAGSLVTSEWGDAAEFSILLQARPLSDVTISLVSSNVAEGTLVTDVTFTPDNWSEPQVVAVTGVDDVRDDGDVAYAITIGPATGDAAYVGVTAPDVPLTNLDDDTSCIAVSPASLVTNEAGMTTATFTIALCSQPTAGVLFSIASTDTSEGTVSPGVFSMTAATWNTPRMITVTGVDDLIADGSIMYDVTVTPTSADPVYGVLPPQVVTVVNTDNELPGITVSPVAGLTTSETGGTAAFTVQLNTMPTSDVTVALSSSDPSEGATDVSSVTITPLTWMTPRTVNVVGQNDDAVDGVVSYAIVTAAAVSADGAYNGINPSDVACQNTDDDVAGVVLSQTSGFTTSETGAWISFSVVLSSQPSASVSISFATSDSSEGLPSPLSLTFTPGNWNVPQFITVAGQDDMLLDGTQIYQIVSAAAVSTDSNYSGVNPADVTLSNIDNDSAAVIVSPTGGAGTNENAGTANIGFVLVSAPSADVTIPLSTGTPSEVSVSPASVTFTPMNWNVWQFATLTGVHDNVFDADAPFTVVTGNTLSADVNYNNVPVSDISGTNRHAMDYIKASNPGADDGFGYRVAISGDGATMAISSIGEASNATGINGNQADNSALSSGAVYVYARTGEVWTQQAYIKSSNSEQDDACGNSLALSHDGNTLAVGCSQESSTASGVNANQADNSGYGTGAVFVFQRSGTAWAQEVYIKASNAQATDRFGTALDLSADGNTLAVSSPEEDSSATGVGGNEASNAAMDAGAAYVFTRSGAMWSQAAYVKASNAAASDYFGWGVAISGDGLRLAVSAAGEDGGSPGINGNQADNSLLGSGAVYVFTNTAGVWAQEAYIKPAVLGAGDAFGREIDLSLDGNTLVAGALGEASASTTINGDANDNSAAYSGAVYVFVRTAGVWSQEAFIKASNSEYGDNFGISVAISEDGDRVVVGAWLEDSNASRIGVGSPANNSTTSSGAAYAFTRSGGTWSQSAYFKYWLPGNIQYFGVSVAVDGTGQRAVVGGYNVSSLAAGVNNYCTGGGGCGWASGVGAAMVF